MSYTKNGFPVEPASKIGQLRIINDPVLQSLLSSFEATGPTSGSSLIQPTGVVALDGPTAITRIVVVDGGEAVIPNPIRRERALGFVTAAALLMRLDDYHALRSSPMADPRDVSQALEKCLWYKPAAMPLSGVTIPGMTVRNTMRAVVNSTLSEANTGLIHTLRFLVYRQWCKGWPTDVEPPSMECLSCDGNIVLPYQTQDTAFTCPTCGHEHYLSDYLGVCEVADDFGREATIANLRNVLEVLMLFDIIRKYRHSKEQLRRTLFIKDGPLLLRAQLSRLVQPIRAFIEELVTSGTPLHIVGVEKNGGLADVIAEYDGALDPPGAFFLPSVKFLLEEVSGVEMPAVYRNRVSFGAKVAVRLGPQHCIVLNVPTGDFKLNPKPTDLIGFADSVRVLSHVLSHRYPNALVPLVLINSMVSISRKPSSTVLETFASGLMATTAL